MKLVVRNTDKPDWKKQMDERVYQKMLSQMRAVFNKRLGSSVAPKENNMPVQPKVGSVGNNQIEEMKWSRPFQL